MEARQQALNVSSLLFNCKLGPAMQLREKAAVAKEEAGGLAPLAHSVLEAQKEEQRRAADLAALKQCALNLATVQALTTTGHLWHHKHSKSNI